MQRFRVWGVTLTAVVIFLASSSGTAAPGREQYTACSNKHFIPEAKRLGFSLDQKPTKDQLSRLQFVLQKKCGHLLKEDSSSVLEQKVSGLWQETDSRGRVLGTYAFKDGQYEMQNLYLVVVGRGKAMVRRGTYKVIGDEIFAQARDSGGLMRTDIFVLKSPNCLLQVGEVLRGKRSAYPNDLQTCATRSR